MNISLFDVIGPVMIGPSSSHTAGAAKLAKMAKIIVNKPFTRVTFGLGGSFASTYKGHFTDYALVAGILGMDEDDEQLAHSFSLAKEQGLAYEFQKVDIESSYENVVRITFHFPEEDSLTIEGASLGGGRILINNIFGNPCEFSATSPTLIILQRDVKGVISNISTTLASHKINIAMMRVNRSKRGDTAFCTIECDETIPEQVKIELESLENIISVIIINI